VAFAAISGIEIVTVLFLCFCFCFGARCGVLCAVAFSLLRCFVFGFSPTAIVLYLIYYPLFALCFGALGKIKDEDFKGFWFLGIIMLVFCAVCILLILFDLIKISKIFKPTIEAFLWILAVLFFVIFLLLIFIKNKRLVVVCAFAAIFTICFTLLDDFITPCFLRYSKEATLAYFYASFLAMLPQTVCSVISVLILFPPLCKLFKLSINKNRE